MTTAQTDETPKDNGLEQAKQAILQAALPHVPFDGWTDATFTAAVSDSGVAVGLARALYPRAGLDLALQYHHCGDAQMVEALQTADLAAMRYSDRVAFAVRTRLDMVTDRELVRRGTTLFALPQNAGEGAKAIWGTADAIWKALGDTSTDLNWYSKRATLSGVYSATVLFWLGDDSPNHSDTWAFLDRRIANVMQIEKIKAALRDNPVARALRSGPFSGAINAMENIKMPERPRDMPGKSGH
jgi:ubiquinone biosynthesis protein COQ9